MIFAEVPVDTKLIKQMFSKTPILTHLNEIREDFEEFNKELFVDEMDLKSNSIKDLRYYKTELFRSYCMGILSAISKKSKFNIKITDEMSRQN